MSIRKRLSKRVLTLYAINTFGEVSGKKALQKIMYFANLKVNIFSFQWNKFGPYSEELNYIFEDGVADGLIDVTPERIAFTGLQLNMQLTEIGKKQIDESRLDPETKSAIDSVFQYLQGKTPRQMELLASAHFIVRSSGDSDSHFVWQIINKLKPYVHFTEEEVAESISTLRTVRLLPSLATTTIA